jgi:hypothetical protein
MAEIFRDSPKLTGCIGNPPGLTGCATGYGAGNGRQAPDLDLI